MSEDKFGAIVVGGGLAGCSAAIVLAKAGVDVLLIERGDYCGEFAWRQGASLMKDGA